MQIQLGEISLGIPTKVRKAPHYVSKGLAKGQGKHFLSIFSKRDPHRHNIDRKSPDIAGNIWGFPIDRNGNRYPSESRAPGVAHDQANRPVKCDMVDVFPRT